MERRGPINNLQLAENLCEISSALREARRVHVKSFGALVPHVFMGSVLAHVGRCLFEDQPHQDSKEIASILAVLESAFAGGDRETRNVISISFVRDAELEPFFKLLRPLMGPKLKVELRG